MIEFAIINKMIDFLKHVFMNNKQPDLQIQPSTKKGGDDIQVNHEQRTSNNISMRQSEQQTLGAGFMDIFHTKTEDGTYTIEKLIQRINALHDDETAELLIAQVLGWKMATQGDNLLAAVLKLGFESLAFQQSPSYMDVFTYDFFMWCVSNCK